MSTIARPGAWDGWRRGVELSWGRLEPRRVGAMVALTLLVAALFGAVCRVHAPIEAPGRAIGLVLQWIVPLATFAVCSMATGRQRLDDSVWALAAHGVPKRQAALGVITVAVALSVITAALATSLALVLAYAGMPGLAPDVATSVWIAALGAASYAAWFALGSAFWRRGRGRWVPLVLDFTLGATHGVLALGWPRAHLVNLAGGSAVLDLSQPSSSVALATITVVAGCLAAMRTGD